MDDNKLELAEKRFKDYHKKIREIRFELLADILKEMEDANIELNETYTLVNSGYDFKLKDSSNWESKIYYKSTDATSSSFMPLCTASLVQLNMILLCISQHTLFIRKFI